MRIIRQIAVAVATTGLLLAAPAVAAAEGYESTGNLHGLSIVPISGVETDSLLEIDRTLNFNSGGDGSSAGSDNEGD
jgi:hypothetical protein